jgi:head-tail adaptor
VTIAKSTISDLRHRVVLCSMKDVVETNGSMELTRKEVVKTWARIRPFVTFGAKGAFISQAGYHILDPNLHQSHWIAIRVQHRVDITAMAWVYEERLKSQPRWFKVLGAIETEDNRWLEIAVHLYERSDSAQPPRNDLSPVQSSVIL